jgi:hypothetical protein
MSKTKAADGRLFSFFIVSYYIAERRRAALYAVNRSFDVKSTHLEVGCHVHGFAWACESV